MWRAHNPWPHLLWTLAGAVHAIEVWRRLFVVQARIFPFRARPIQPVGVHLALSRPEGPQQAVLRVDRSRPPLLPVQPDRALRRERQPHRLQTGDGQSIKIGSRDS